MKLAYHGYHSPWANLSFRDWLFFYWHDFWPADSLRGVVEERGIQILGCYLIWRRVGRTQNDHTTTAR